MRWRAQSVVGAVDLPAGSTTANQAKIANPLGSANACEDERHAWVKTLWGAFIKGRDVKTLRGHTRTNHRLRGAAHTPPHTPELTSETVIVLAALGLPGADPVLGPAHFDHARQFGMIGRAPVEPVATEVDETPTLVLVRGIGIKHALRGIFRVSAGYDAAIGGQQGHALRIQIVFGNHVIAKTFGVEPVDDVSIGRELPEALFRAHIQHRSQARGVADPTAITVLIVHGDTKLWMFVQEQGSRIDHGKIADDIFALAPFDLDMPVGVGPVARRG